MDGNRYELNEVGNIGLNQIYKMYETYRNAGYAKLIQKMECDRIYEDAQGYWLKDVEGNVYLDFLGGFGAFNIGHNHPKVHEALEYIKNRPNLVHIGLNPYEAVLANNLASLTDGKLTRSFFCNGGAETVESALKLARVATGRKKLLYCTNSYHGKTFAALSVTGHNRFKHYVEPLVPECEQVLFGDIDSLEEKLRDKKAAAFLLEAIQGEGGVIEPPESYLYEVRKLCTKYETLMILDEIQTGLGRTGKMFAYEHEEIVPDILCLAKSLGGGMIPIGAYLTTEQIYQRAYGDIDKCMMDSSTFGGNTYACAAAIATIEVLLKEELPRKAKETGDYLKARLLEIKEKYDDIKDVRGKGLLIGIEFYENTEKNATFTASRLIKKYRILTAYSPNNPNMIRLEPPLHITRNQVDTFIHALNDILKD